MYGWCLKSKGLMVFAVFTFAIIPNSPGASGHSPFAWRQAFSSGTVQEQSAWPPPPPVPGPKELVGTLTWIPRKHLYESDEFELRLRNTAETPVILFRWRYEYEVRVFDARGKQVSDQQAYLSRIKLMIPAPWEWIVLWPQDSLSFRLHASTEEGAMKLPKGEYSADCIGMHSGAAYGCPALIKESRATIVPFASSPSIHFRPSLLSAKTCFATS